MERPTKAFLSRLDACRKRMYASGRVETLRELLERSKKYYGGREQFAEKVKKETVFYSVDRFYSDVSAVGEKLMSLGGCVHAAIVGENSYGWVVAFFAAACSGNVAVPIDRELDDGKIAELAEKAECRVMFFSPAYSGAARLFLEGKEDRIAICLSSKPRGIVCPELSDIVSAFSETPSFASVSPKPEDTAVIIFTSGTTGANKGVMLSHANLCSNFTDLAHTIKPVSSAMSVLPMNHAYELSCIVLTAIYMNALLYINDSLRRFEKNLAEFHPEAMAAVPMLLDSVYKLIVSRAEEKGKAKKLFRCVKLSNFLLKLGIDLRKILFGEITAQFGYKLPAISVGGAPTDGEKAAFLASLGFDIYVGYGLTEASPIVTLNRDVIRAPDSVGKCLPGCELRISEPDENGIGEIEIRGKNVSNGYWKDEEADRLSFRNGWFLTGDYGRIGKDGELYIVGRKKNIIILDNGKNIYTEELENHFVRNSDIIKEAVVFAAEKPTPSGKSKYLAMTVFAAPDGENGMNETELQNAVEAELERLNASLPPHERVAEVVTVTEELKKTSTLKIIRSEAEKIYKEYKKERSEKHD